MNKGTEKQDYKTIPKFPNFQTKTNTPNTMKKIAKIQNRTVK
jgi:hypothetical protein